jgi:hypothetical protein
MNFEKVVFAFFVLLAAALNVSFVWGDADKVVAKKGVLPSSLGLSVLEDKRLAGPQIARMVGRLLFNGQVKSPSCF